MFGTFYQSDVEILLKDITGLVEPQPASVREPLIQSGVHYSEMLPVEYVPTDEYMKLFEDALERYAVITAEAVLKVATKIYKAKRGDVVLVSLARAGIPVGVLIKRCLRSVYGADVPHYAISIIRGKGIDANALNYILSHHAASSIQFVDGWTGKGAIQKELARSLENYPQIDSGLAVLSDPANVAGLCGTHEDILIASSCLNSTVSGLLSRTFLREDVIGPADYHGAAFYKDLTASDLTYRFIDTIVSCMQKIQGRSCMESETVLTRSGLEEVEEIAERFGIKDINLIKPGIGEATRVLLRRMPWKILVSSLEDDAHLGHLYQLAKEKGVDVEAYPLKNYKACGLIREMADC